MISLRKETFLFLLQEFLENCLYNLDGVKIVWYNLVSVKIERKRWSPKVIIMETCARH